MHLASKAEGEGQRGKPLQAEHHGADVVRDPPDITDRLACLRLGLETQEVPQGRLRALDLRREHRLFPHVHVEEQLLARQEHGYPVQPSQRPFGEAETLQEREDVDGRVRRKLGWHERADRLSGGGGVHEAAQPWACCVGFNHAMLRLARGI